MSKLSIFKMVKGEDLLTERKKKVLNSLKNKRVWIYIIILVILLSFSTIMRTSNFRTGNGLKDATTGNYTLGPDLDPFFFLRWTQYIINQGAIPANDAMRYVPAGYDTTQETKLLPYTLAYFYKFLHLFNNNISLEFAVALAPAIFFIFAALFFFLFTRRLFIKKNVDVRNIIALIATLFFIVSPILLHRTTGGIPEKESLGFAFMTISLYLFILSLQTKKLSSNIIFSSLTGIFIGFLGLVWGGVSFMFVSLALFMLIKFFIGYEEKEILTYSFCIIFLTLLLGFFTKRYGGIMGMISSSTTGLLYLIWLLFLIEKGISLLKLDEKFKINKKLITLGIVVFAVIIFLFIRKDLILHILSDVKTKIIHPLGTDRLGITVAENSQPYFATWVGNFGTMVFWTFMIASIVLFLEAISHFKIKEKVILCSGFVLFLLGVVFSRYARSSVLNGENFFSTFIYFGSFILLIACFAYIYFKEKDNRTLFKTISNESIFLLVLFIWGLASARGAIRMVMFLVPAVSILIPYLACELPSRAIANKEKEDTKKIIFWVCAALVIFVTINSLFVFSKSCYSEAQNTRPGAYQVQWQYAMSWVRESTAKDSVFAHWWDYGYWIQTIGERATVLDGGNSFPYWDYLMGRHVLTGQTEKEALEFLKTHKANYLLIDSTDVGKYTAYSSIGSDENYDRYSQIGTFSLDTTNIQEMRNYTQLVYAGGTLFDKDFTWFSQSRDKSIVFRAWNNDAVIAAFFVYTDKDLKTIVSQSQAVVFYQGKQFEEKIPIRYTYVESENKMYDFGSGMEATVYILPSVSGNSINLVGASLFISEKSMKALWVKLYLFNDATNFELVHSEPSLFVSQLRSAGYNIPDIVLYGDIQGPIKIWKINYPQDIKENPDYLLLDYPNQNLSIASVKFN